MEREKLLFEMKNIGIMSPTQITDFASKYKLSPTTIRIWHNHLWGKVDRTEYIKSKKRDSKGRFTE
jgi:uncharacterized protein YjcR